MRSDFSLNTLCRYSFQVHSFLAKKAPGAPVFGHALVSFFEKGEFRLSELCIIIYPREPTAPDRQIMAATRSVSLMPSSDPSSELHRQTSGSGVHVCARVRDIAQGNANVSVEMPATRAACETLVSIERLVGTATLFKDDLAELVEKLDVVAVGVLDRCVERVGKYDQLLQELQAHLDRAKDVASLCNKARSGYGGQILRRRVSKRLDSIKTQVACFANEGSLAHTREVYEVRIINFNFLLRLHNALFTVLVCRLRMHGYHIL